VPLGPNAAVLVWPAGMGARADTGLPAAEALGRVLELGLGGAARRKVGGGLAWVMQGGQLMVGIAAWCAVWRSLVWHCRCAARAALRR
jgi:hypothetical protein